MAVCEDCYADVLAVANSPHPAAVVLCPLDTTPPTSLRAVQSSTGEHRTKVVQPTEHTARPDSPERRLGSF